MTPAFRSALALSILAIVLVACGTTVGAPASEDPAPSQPASPSVEPSEAPSEAPVEPSAPDDEARDIDGTLTVYPGTWSGQGASIQDALDAGPTGPDLPILVKGILFRDTDGRIYLATSVSDVTVPTFEAPMLEVLGYGNDGPVWDMENAEMLGLREANGVVFQPESSILGTLEVR